MVSIPQYRQKPVSQHSKEDRQQYIALMKKQHGGKMKKGTKVLVNLRGKNVEATITKDATPQSTSLEVNINGKVMRKDIATIYGIAGDKKGVEEAEPPKKLVAMAKKGAEPTTPRKLKLQKKGMSGGKAVKSAGTPRKKVPEGVPPKKKTGYNPTGKKQAKTIEGEISNLMKASDRLQGNGY